MIAIVDYGAGNLFSVANALEHLSISYQITQEPQALYESDGVLLPGVGAFPDAMAMLREKDLIPILRQMAKKKPFLGICLGMQVLFCQGEEFCLTKGLGLLKGQVKKMNPPGLKIPHMGWNSLRPQKPSPLLDGLPEEPYVYFVHSYACEAQRPEDVLTTTEYGRPFHSAVQRGNVMGMQFHPEKSGLTGQRLLRNFVEMTRAASGKEG